jgi:hypothetical protein
MFRFTGSFGDRVAGSSFESTFTSGFLVFKISHNVVIFALNFKFKPPKAFNSGLNAVLNIANPDVFEGELTTWSYAPSCENQVTFVSRLTSIYTWSISKVFDGVENFADRASYKVHPSRTTTQASCQAKRDTETRDHNLH